MKSYKIIVSKAWTYSLIAVLPALTVYLACLCSLCLAMDNAGDTTGRMFRPEQFGAKGDGIQE